MADTGIETTKVGCKGKKGSQNWGMKMKYLPYIANYTLQAMKPFTIYNNTHGIHMN
jgi:hypothetical protein